MPDKPELIWEPGAVDDLTRLREFIQPHNPKAAANAARRIIEAANLLLDNPFLGLPIEEMPEFNQLFIPFGERGYTLRYRVERQKIIILRIWHARENR
jgi:plasmid stabilization system protein ParE